MEEPAAEGSESESDEEPESGSEAQEGTHRKALTNSKVVFEGTGDAKYNYVCPAGHRSAQVDGVGGSRAGCRCFAACRCVGGG